MAVIDKSVQSLFDNTFGHRIFDYEKSEMPWLFDLIKNTMQKCYDNGIAQGYANCMYDNNLVK